MRRIDQIRLDDTGERTEWEFTVFEDAGTFLLHVSAYGTPYDGDRFATGFHIRFDDARDAQDWIDTTREGLLRHMATSDYAKEWYKVTE